MGAFAVSYPQIAGSLMGQSTHHPSVRERMAAAFRRAVGHTRSPAKELARRIDRTPKGAELILRGDTSPNLETLVAACREYDEVWEAFREICGRADSVSQAERVLAEITEKLRETRAL